MDLVYYHFNYVLPNWIELENVESIEVDLKLGKNAERHGVLTCVDRVTGKEIGRNLFDSLSGSMGRRHLS